jgi:SAM-dependent methyltransferase
MQNSQKNVLLSSAYNESIQQDLLVLQEAVHYRKWLFSLIKPHLGRTILEIGAGIGNYTELLSENAMVFATDFDPYFVQHLAERFRDNSCVFPDQLDLTDISASTRRQYAEAKVDTIVCLNVLEHIRDDSAALRALQDCLAPGGRMIFILPANPLIYNQLDRAYGHYRRYTKRDAPRLVAGSSMQVTVANYFNMLGILGWWVNGRLSRKTQLPSRQTKIFNFLTPFLATFERYIPPSFGLSLLLVLEHTPHG